MKILSFALSGSFAAFRDPTVTSNQNVYYIPSKSAVIGILGAMIGIPRSLSLGEIYGKEYRNFFGAVKIGISLENEPTKITLFTNHRSLKEPKTKPFKTELLESPKYTIYVSSTDENLKKLENAISSNKFAYSPYLGHAYCPALISDLRKYDAAETDPRDKITKCVILDESEPYRGDFSMRVGSAVGTDHKIIIERHLHHYIKNDVLERIVLKHWIPINSQCKIDRLSKTTLSTFVEIDDGIICMY